jgi:glycosyltransferase involved in cell wall biosynthesis
MALKVCQLCAVDFTLQHFLLPLIDGMTEAGWDVTAVCSDGPAIPELRQRGYRIRTVPITRSLNPLSHIRPVLALVRLFRQERFDVIHVHTPVAALIGRMAARLSGRSLVVYTAHGFYFHDEMPRWRRRVFVLLEKFGGRLTDLLFTQSAEDAQAAIDEGIMAPRATITIGNGVDAKRFDPARVEDGRSLRLNLGVPAGGFLVGMVGRLVREKGVAEFLEAAVKVAASNDNAYFVLVGERLPSDHAGGVEEDIRRAQAVLGMRLVLTGSRRDIPELLAAMDVFCLPSYREGMPRTVIEAMMMAKPAIATDIRGCREEVVAGQTGWLVPTRDAAALASAIRRCLEDPERARVMGVAGRIRALDLYAEDRIVAKQIGCIRELAGTMAARRT